MKDKPKTAAERQRKRFQALREKGLVPFQIWVKPEHKPKVKEFADSLEK